MLYKILFGILTVGSIFISSQVDVFEVFFRWSRISQPFFLAEIIELALFMAIVLALHKFQQAKQLRHANAHLKKLNTELEGSLFFQNQLNDNMLLTTSELYDSRAELMKSKNYMDSVLKSLADPLFILNPDLTIKTISPNTQTLLGYQDSELAGAPFLFLLDPEEDWQALRSFLIEGAVNNFEYKLLTKSGEKIPVLFSGAIMSNKQGEVQGFVCLAHDITHRKQMEESLKNSEAQMRSMLEQRVAERTRELEASEAKLSSIVQKQKLAQEELVKNRNLLEAIVEGTTDSMYIKDIAGYYLLCNRSATKRIGKPLKEILYRQDTDLFSSDYAQKVREIDHQIMAQEVVKTFEETIEVAGQYKTLMTTKGVYRDEHGRVSGLFGISRDITEQKLLERQLRQKQKMEAIGTLAGGIAHDFNNLLFGMLGYIEMFKESLSPENPYQDDLGEVLQAAYRAKDLVSQILAFSRQGEEEVSALLIGPILKEALKLLRSSLPTTVEICTEINQSDAHISANPTQIHQIIMNLCTNASYAMEAGGGRLKVSLKETYITPKFADLHEMHAGKYLKLTVSDTGHGMSQEILDRIFEPFFTTKPVGEGTGMGLAVVHGIVKNYGGTIVASSQLGKGSTFRIFFPVILVTKSHSATSDLPLSQGQGSILLVDDEPVIIKMLSKFLMQMGFNVISSNSSKKALKLFQQNPHQFDLVLTDQTMPHLTGCQLSQKIREIHPTIPIILMTGFDKNLSSEITSQNGIQKFLIKPIERHQLSNTIQHLISNPTQPKSP